MWAHYEAALQLMAAEFLGQWSPAVPRPVTTLEALLGHITEHLLQLGRGGGVPAKKWFVHGQSRNGSGKGAGPRMHVCTQGALGQGVPGQMAPAD